MYANGQHSRGSPGADPGSAQQQDKCQHPHGAMAIDGDRSHKRIMRGSRVMICSPNIWRNESLLVTWMTCKSTRMDEVRALPAGVVLSVPS